MKPHLDTLFFGDCLDVLGGWDGDVADLIYLDPPFNSNAVYDVNLQSPGEPRRQDPRSIAFGDTWRWDESAVERLDRLERSRGDPTRELLIGFRHALGATGMLAYLTYMGERLVELHRVLKPTGTLYLHCDPTSSHYLKVLADQVFGADNFLSEVVWNYGTPSGGRASGRRPVKAHDTLLAYAREYSRHTFNRLYTEYTDDYKANWFRNEDEDGRRYQTRMRSGAIVRQYLDETPGMPLSNVWSDIMQLYARSGWFADSTASREKTGFPTQKPVELLERVIAVSSNPGDVVLDPFSGSGTTLAAASRLDRRWLGIDLSPTALELTRSRRFPCDGVEISGFPSDMAAARSMAVARPSDFRRWAVTRVAGLAQAEPRLTDRGIDGVGRTLEPARGIDARTVLAQVQAGPVEADSLRSLAQEVEREDAALGVLITLDGVAGSAPADAGEVVFGSSRYSKVLDWSIEQWFDGCDQPLPALVDPYTGGAMMGTLSA